MTTTATRHRQRIRLAEYLGGECAVCGTTEPGPTARSPVDGWEFDHSDHALKTRLFRAVSHRPWEEVLAWVRIEGIQLLCSDCHLDKSTYEKIEAAHRRRSTR